MIFILAAVLGLVAGLIRAKMKSIQYLPQNMKYVWLILLAFISQWFVFSLPVSREQIPNTWVPFILIGSQAILLLFTWLNRHQTGIWLLGLGLLLNLIVIFLNKGWMPISPETLNYLHVPSSTWQVWQRHGFSKDMVIPLESTKAWILSDIVPLNLLDRYKIAFSIGDIFIASGIFVNLTSIRRIEALSKECLS
ncbi:MAG: DUF5317 domain-containing protein [Anaerolineaceae bacterium]|nr:DUF5317 domain-containing protein [Anaerolineaceae bacterium]